MGETKRNRGLRATTKRFLALQALDHACRALAGQQYPGIAKREPQLTAALEDALRILADARYEIHHA